MNTTRILNVLGVFAVVAVVTVSSAQSGTYTEQSGHCANSPDVKVYYTKTNRDTCVCVRTLVANCTRAPVTTTTTKAPTTTTTTEPRTTTAGPVADYHESSVLCLLSPAIQTVIYNKTNGDKCRCVKALLANCTRAPVTNTTTTEDPITTTTEATTTTITVPTTTTTR